MPLISKKKKSYRISRGLQSYLETYGRTAELPVRYDDLRFYGDATPVYDKKGRDTLWASVLYPSSDRKTISSGLVKTYAILKVMGDTSLMKHLITDRIDVCSYGNTKPFRVRILNEINENFDYFYVKRADASRVYGLELEHILSPNRIEFLVDGDTLIEEHIAGIPGDVFCAEWLKDTHLDEVRLAKEFVKFNERCAWRLLGDMHSGNWVVDVTPDFDETMYRIRAIDFDQQSHEGRFRVYLPQYYPENNPIIKVGMRCMTPESVEQYQEEERTLIRHRISADHERLDALLDAMIEDELAPSANVEQLRADLLDERKDSRFADCTTMGGLVRASLDLLMER